MAGASTEEVENNEHPETEKTKTVKDEAVSEIPQECLIKHPLQHEWTLWYLEPDRSKSWEDMQNKVTSFDTVEDFWSLYNHIKVVSEIKMGCDYSLFKKNIRPMWEDDRNKQGGRWIINVTRQQRRNELDALWLDVILCLIGEAFDYGEEICGAVVNVRPRGDRISIWTANAANVQAVMSIGHKIKESLNFPKDFQIGYELHKDSVNKQQTQKMTYYV